MKRSETYLTQAIASDWKRYVDLSTKYYKELKRP